MKIKQAVFPVVFLGLLFIVTGCNADDSPGNFNSYAELNGDGKPEIIFGDYGLPHFNYVDYNLRAKFSSETTQTEPRLIRQFKNRPDQIHFTDIDKDGDLDLVFSTYGLPHFNYVDYDTYVAKNDGTGNFGSPELINRQKK